MGSVQEGRNKRESSATDVLRLARDRNGWNNMNCRSMAPVKRKAKKMSTLTNDV